MKFILIFIQLIRAFFEFIARVFYSFIVLFKIDFGKNFKVNFPLDIRGGGHFEIGDNCRLGKKTFIRFGGKVNLGSNSHIHQQAMLLSEKHSELFIDKNFQLEPYCVFSVKKSKWKIGENVSISSYCQLYSREKGVEGKLEIGNNSNISNNCIIDIAGNVFIGDDVAIGNNSFIFTHNHDYTDKNLATWKGGLHIHDVTIGSGSWIGANSKILPGVKIGDRVVIAAGSIVTKDVPSNTIFAGNPAKFLKSI